jgi:hypothetical protein
MKRMIDLTTTFEPVGELRPIEPAGPIVPVRRDGRTRWLQDGRWLPAWLVWLRRKRVGRAVLLVALGGAWAAWRLVGGAR